MNEHVLADRALSMTRGYRDAPQGAFALAWRAMRLLESTREAARNAEVLSLVRGHGIPDSPVSRFACAIMESTGRMPANGTLNVRHALEEGCFLAFKTARALRRKQVLASAPAAQLARLTRMGWLTPEPEAEEL